MSLVDENVADILHKKNNEDYRRGEWESVSWVSIAEKTLEHLMAK